MAIDPVCGMEVDEGTAKDKSIEQGQTYYFCSKDCKDEFDADPEEYIGGEMATGT
jgi:YHS domain-containing protein